MASGKSTFYSQRFSRSHLRLNLDMLRTRRRERVLFDACLQSQTRVLIDNTNASLEERAQFIIPARAAGFRIVGYYLRTDLRLALERNAARLGSARVPDVGLLAVHARLALPSLDEGFDDLFYVSEDGHGGFRAEPWRQDEATLQVLGAHLSDAPIYKDREP